MISTSPPRGEVGRRPGEGRPSPVARECPLTPTLSPNGARAIGVSYRHAVNTGSACFTSPPRGEVGRRPGEGRPSPVAQECPLTPTLSPNGARAIGVSYRHAVNAGAVCFTSPQRGEVGRRPGEGLMPGNPGTPPLPIGARCRLHCTALLNSR